ncbi:MAG: peptidoglycan editing factor PgeF [Desulfatiglandales bacterium]
MDRYEQSGLLAFQFEELSRYPIVHLVFSRYGGISPANFASLNVGASVGDHLENIRENTRRICEGIGVDRILTINQVHADTVFMAKDVPLTPPEADAVITDVTMLPIMVKCADCQAIIIYDPSNHALGMIHCGWRGNKLNLPNKVVRKMSEKYGSKPEELVVAIGPSLGVCCAEYRNWREVFPDFFLKFRVNSNFFDLKAITKWQLITAGVLASNIFDSKICTSCTTQLFYSYRKENKTGRFPVIAYLSPK